MKILLIGDFSALHRYLKQGLIKNGYTDVKLASSGDGWKKIPGADYVIHNSDYPILKQYYNYVSPFRLLEFFNGYDVVQFINPIIFSLYINTIIFNYIKRYNNMVSLVSAGDDLSYLHAYENHIFQYHPFDYDKTFINKCNENAIKGRVYRKVSNKIEKAVDIIIPSLYEYRIGYINRNFGNKTSRVIPFPINIDEIKYTQNIVKNKIVFFHGLNRELFKGTRFIREALLKLKENYPNDVEVIIDGHMPFDEYIRVIRRANVIVDQCCTYGYGINACISMAQGKVVMSGCNTKTIKAFGLHTSPIINTKPDVNYLYNQMLYILENKNNITEWGFNSRKYVENIHDYSKVAQMYVNTWKNLKH